jgi:hypothetical protein
MQIIGTYLLNKLSSSLGPGALLCSLQPRYNDIKLAFLYFELFMLVRIKIPNIPQSLY